MGRKSNGFTEVKKISLKIIEPDPNQPRIEFDEGKLNELAMSIQAAGQRIPIIVRNHPSKVGKYYIVDGERRWRACQIVGVDTMTAYLFEGNETEIMIQQAISNFTREGHTPLETAHIISKLKKKLNVNNKALSALFGKSEAWVLQHQNLLTLDKEVLRFMKLPIPIRDRLPLSTALLLVPYEASVQVNLAKEFFQYKVGFKTAKLRVQKLNNQMKQSGTKKIKPYTEIRKLESFVKTSSNALEVLLGMHDDVFKIGLRNKPSSFTKVIASRLTVLQSQIQKIKSKITNLS